MPTRSSSTRTQGSAANSATGSTSTSCPARSVRDQASQSQPTTTASRRTTRSAPGSPTFGARAERSAGDFDRQYNLEFTAGVQHQVAPRLAVGFMFYKRQIKNIQLTDRTLITEGELHRVQHDHSRVGLGQHRQRSGRSRRVESERGHHAVQPEPGEQRRVQSVDGRSQQRGQQVAVHRHGSVVLHAVPGRLDRFRQLDGGAEYLRLLRIGRQPERTDLQRSLSGTAGVAGRAILRSAELRHSLHPRVQTGGKLLTAVRGHRLRGGAAELRRPGTRHHLAARGERVSRINSGPRRRPS